MDFMYWRMIHLRKVTIGITRISNWRTFYTSVPSKFTVSYMETGQSFFDFVRSENGYD